MLAGSCKNNASADVKQIHCKILQHKKKRLERKNTRSADTRVFGTRGRSPGMPLSYQQKLEPLLCKAIAWEHMHVFCSASCHSWRYGLALFPFGVPHFNQEKEKTSHMETRSLSRSFTNSFVLMCTLWTKGHLKGCIIVKISISPTRKRFDLLRKPIIFFLLLNL